MEILIALLPGVIFLLIVWVVSYLHDKTYKPKGRHFYSDEN